MPRHLAGAGPASGAPAPVPGLDLDLAARNVRRAGGDPERFAAALGAAQRADAASEHTVALAGVAAWRAGALAFRDDALARIDVLRGEPAGGRAVAAALGIAEAALAEFAERQRTDPLWWPGRTAERGYVCAVGGFRGLGGAWLAPPGGGYALAEPGAFAIAADERWWRLDADVWGSRLTRLDDEPGPAASDSLASIVCPQDSYLAWVHVRDAA
ncbi:potassium transporter Kef [Microbacterium sp. M3]|uniref:Potassium transporter Kef n=1 Tax=Microbacterium arthrosphaerae TaxID=792652 RepID=A0ABU4GXA4_9MICO|nr:MULTISPECIES: potassium transporter Kef [Microbacterium]MDW4571703.1 potassium transporter Kef [Microbacterium arthrosphaerae]MDW7605558.1 potassium transporter Kef [Microbacterium sp. M3]